MWDAARHPTFYQYIQQSSEVIVSVADEPSHLSSGRHSSSDEITATLASSQTSNATSNVMLVDGWPTV